MKLLDVVALVEDLPELNLYRGNVGTIVEEYEPSILEIEISDDFSADSDVDILVEFDPNHIPGLIRLAGMELELTELLNRKVDLRTAEDLSPYFRQEVMTLAVEQYVCH